MGSTKVRTMVWKEKEQEKEKEKAVEEQKEPTVRTIQLDSGNILALPLLLCFRNLLQAGGIFLSQALQQASRTGNF